MSDMQKDWTLRLDEGQSKFLRDCVIGNEDEANPIVLSAGYGFEGYGLYAWLEEYPEEGGFLIKKLRDPKP